MSWCREQQQQAEARHQAAAQAAAREQAIERAELEAAQAAEAAAAAARATANKARLEAFKAETLAGKDNISMVILVSTLARPVAGYSLLTVVCKEQLCVQ